MGPYSFIQRVEFIQHDPELPLQLVPDSEHGFDTPMVLSAHNLSFH